MCSVLLSTTMLIIELMKEAQYWRITVLDVGHGLSIIIEKSGKVILYDLGQRWAMGSIAKSVIAPVLLQQDIDKIDGVIISHSDQDHLGDLSAIIQQFSPVD